MNSGIMAAPLLSRLAIVLSACSTKQSIIKFRTYRYMQEARRRRLIDSRSNHGSQVCYASKVSGGLSRNKRKRTRNAHRGIKVEDGEDVRKGSILCTQLQLRYYPGEHVKIGRDFTLNALVDGKVWLTKEVLNPYPDSPIYPGVQKGEVIERLFVHVIPEPQHQNFKLISLT